MWAAVDSILSGEVSILSMFCGGIAFNSLLINIPTQIQDIMHYPLHHGEHYQMPAFTFSNGTIHVWNELDNNSRYYSSIILSFENALQPPRAVHHIPVIFSHLSYKTGGYSFVQTQM